MTTENKIANAVHWTHPMTFGATVIGLAILAFAAWASWAPLSGAVVAMGLVKTELNRKAVQHPEGGIIKTIHVRDGDMVRVGQPLAELDSVSTDSNHRLLLEMTAFETLKRDRLDAEQQLQSVFNLDRGLVGFFGEALIQPAYQRELKIFRARRDSLDQQLATLSEQLKAIELERRALQDQIKADRDSIRLVDEELAMNRSLESQKFVSKARVLSYERAIADYQSKLSEHEATLAQTVQRTNDVKLRMSAIRTDYQRMASEEYKESSTRLVELRERLRPAEDAMQRKIIHAPVSGRVVGLRFHAPGQVAGPRDVLMEIVPDEEALVLEAQVSVDGIRQLYVNQSADIRFTAFKSRTTPIVTGRVIYVSADALTDKNGIPFYQVHIRPDPASLKKAGITHIQPGMAAEVFMRTEERTALDYLLSPVTDTLRKSMREM